MRLAESRADVAAQRVVVDFQNPERVPAHYDHPHRVSAEGVRNPCPQRTSRRRALQRVPALGVLSMKPRRGTQEMVPREPFMND